jgi:hypothetical protein
MFGETKIWQGKASEKVEARPTSVVGHCSLADLRHSELQSYPTVELSFLQNTRLSRDQLPSNMSSRIASHAGSWYTDDGKELSSQLDNWLAAVPSKAEGIGALSSKEAALDIPSAGARAIIAP